MTAHMAKLAHKLSRQGLQSWIQLNTATIGSKVWHARGRAPIDWRLDLHIHEHFDGRLGFAKRAPGCFSPKLRQLNLKHSQSSSVEKLLVSWKTWWRWDVTCIFRFWTSHGPIITWEPSPNWGHRLQAWWFLGYIRPVACCWCTIQEKLNLIYHVNSVWFVLKCSMLSWWYRLCTFIIGRDVATHGHMCSKSTHSRAIDSCSSVISEGTVTKTFRCTCTFEAMSHGSDARATRDHRDVLRFIYQTTAKGQGKSFQDWKQSWRLCLQESSSVQANSLEGTLFSNYYVWVCLLMFEVCFAVGLVRSAYFQASHVGILLKCFVFDFLCFFFNSKGHMKYIYSKF